MDDKGTPTRDHQDPEDLEPEREGEAVSDQSGETAPAGADRHEEGAEGEDQD